MHARRTGCQVVHVAVESLVSDDIGLGLGLQRRHLGAFLDALSRSAHGDDLAQAVLQSLSLRRLRRSMGRSRINTKLSTTARQENHEQTYVLCGCFGAQLVLREPHLLDRRQTRHVRALSLSRHEGRLRPGHCRRRRRRASCIVPRLWPAVGRWPRRCRRGSPTAPPQERARLRTHTPLTARRHLPHGRRRHRCARAAAPHRITRHAAQQWQWPCAVPMVSTSRWRAILGTSHISTFM